MKVISKIINVLSTVIKKGQPPNNIETNGTQYTAEELMFLITNLGEQQFKIKDIEFIYNIILKLQNDYISKSKK